MIKKILKKINIKEFICAIVCVIVTLLLFVPFYFFELTPNSDFLFILMWLILADMPFIFIITIFNTSKLSLSKESNMTTFIIFNSLLVLIASLVLITSNSQDGSLDVFFFFIAVQSFIGAMVSQKKKSD
jgi:hypothetical protein